MTATKSRTKTQAATGTEKKEETQPPPCTTATTIFGASIFLGLAKSSRESLFFFLFILTWFRFFTHSPAFFPIPIDPLAAARHLGTNFGQQLISFHILCKCPPMLALFVFFFCRHWVVWEIYTLKCFHNESAENWENNRRLAHVHVPPLFPWVPELIKDFSDCFSRVHWLLPAPENHAKHVRMSQNSLSRSWLFTKPLFGYLVPVFPHSDWPFKWSCRSCGPAWQLSMKIN